MLLSVLMRCLFSIWALLYRNSLRSIQRLLMHKLNDLCVRFIVILIQYIYINNAFKKCTLWISFIILYSFFLLLYVQHWLILWKLPFLYTNRDVIHIKNYKMQLIFDLVCATHLSCDARHQAEVFVVGARCRCGASTVSQHCHMDARLCKLIWKYDFKYFI